MYREVAFISKGRLEWEVYRRLKQSPVPTFPNSNRLNPRPSYGYPLVVEVLHEGCG